MDEVEIKNLSVHVVWSSQTGAKAKHVKGGAELMQDARARHYWDPERRIGAAFQGHIANLSSPAWDVWMLFAPGVLWEGETPPAPTWWEHQLSGLEDYTDLRLDPVRFARKALEMSSAD
ncbi:MAG: hypothetical protein ACE5GX_01965 [Thermoanaerobaculia bacterium]